MIYKIFTGFLLSFFFLVIRWAQWHTKVQPQVTDLHQYTKRTIKHNQQHVFFVSTTMKNISARKSLDIKLKCNINSQFKYQTYIKILL